MVDPKVIFGRLGNSMFQGAYIYAQMKRGLIPDIFVQDYRYFEEFKDEIKKLFGSDIPERIDKVAIHVRRGANPINPNEPKYSENPFYVNLYDTDYYEKAMALFPNDEFLIFSDDPLWCEAQDLFKDFEISYKTELEDLNKMASCKAHIIANSSFSFWGAFISPYTEKVIAPKLWFTDGVERVICPPEWFKI